jgi:hypothetical protein
MDTCRIRAVPAGTRTEWDTPHGRSWTVPEPPPFQLSPIRNSTSPSTDGGTKQRPEQPVVEALQQMGPQFTTEGMMQEPVLELPPAGVPRPRGHQKTHPIGTCEDEQSQDSQQQVNLAERDQAAASLLALSVYQGRAPILPRHGDASTPVLFRATPARRPAPHRTEGWRRDNPAILRRSATRTRVGEVAEYGRARSRT